MPSLIRENEFINDLSRCINVRVINDKSDDEYNHSVVFEFDPDVDRQPDSSDWLESLKDYIIQLSTAKEMLQNVTENPPGPGVPPKITYMVEVKASYVVHEKRPRYKPEKAGHIFEYEPYKESLKTQLDYQDSPGNPFKVVGTVLDLDRAFPARTGDPPELFWDLINEPSNMAITGMLEKIDYEMNITGRYSSFLPDKTRDKINLVIKEAQAQLDFQEKQGLLANILHIIERERRKKKFTIGDEIKELEDKLKTNHFGFDQTRYHRALEYFSKLRYEGKRDEELLDDTYQYLYFLYEYEGENLPVYTKPFKVSKQDINLDPAAVRVMMAARNKTIDGTQGTSQGLKKTHSSHRLASKVVGTPSSASNTAPRRTLNRNHSGTQNTTPRKTTNMNETFSRSASRKTRNKTSSGAKNTARKRSKNVKLSGTASGRDRS